MNTDRELPLSTEEENALTFEEHDHPLSCDEESETALPKAKAENPANSSGKDSLELKISLSLLRKLHEKAREEGIQVEELASELLAEGLVLRAWEIMERKSAMKGSSSHPQSGVNRNPRHSYNRGNGNNFSGKGRGRSGNSQFQNKGQKKQKFSHGDLNDNANFIEYVRNQEKKKNW